MSGVPNVFGSATSSIPLSQLDVNFNTPLYIGNTSVGLGNTVTSFGNVTLVNATLTSANVSISGGTANGVVYINSSNVAVASPTVFALDTNGNLGLGVTPSAWNSGIGFPALQLKSGGAFWSTTTNGTVYSQNEYYGSGGATYITTAPASYYQQYNGTHIWAVAPSGTAGNVVPFITAMTLDNSGNLGIGTTPGTKLDIDSGATSGAILRIRSSSYNSSGLTFNIGTDASVGLGSVGAVPLFFNTNNTERMRIDSSGNLLVGTTSALFGNSSRLTIAQSTTGAANIFVNPPASYTGTSIISGSVTAAGTGWYHFAGQSGNGSTITTNNIFIFGNGNIQNANNSYGAISDISLKENIVDATPKLNDLIKVQIRNYNLKNDETKTKQIGVVAQELEQIFPSMIETDKDGIKGVKYSVFVPILIKAIQELSAEVTALKAKVGA